MRATLAALTLLASIPNCTDLYTVATHGLETPVVTTQPNGATAAPAPNGVLVAIQLQATNPNDFPISADSVDYQVSIQGSQVFSGTQEGVTVDENSSDQVTVQGVVDTSQPVFRTFRSGQTVTFTITGVAHADSPAGVGIDVAFSATESFVVPSGLPALP